MIPQYYNLKAGAPGARLIIHFSKEPSYVLQQSPNLNLFLHQVMEQNFSKNLQLKDFARLCNRSLSSFKRDFSATFKTTPGRWLANKRLEYAQALLSTTYMSVSEVSLECGYTNYAHFSRAFKQRFGHAPTLFRKQLEISA
jgi:AraC family transcriptional regulator, exoenzyme S synthesis regulatory protein ExsA